MWTNEWWNWNFWVSLVVVVVVFWRAPPPSVWESCWFDRPKRLERELQDDVVVPVETLYLNE